MLLPSAGKTQTQTNQSSDKSQKWIEAKKTIFSISHEISPTAPHISQRRANSSLHSVKGSILDSGSHLWRQKALSNLYKRRVDITSKAKAQTCSCVQQHLTKWTQSHELMLQSLDFVKLRSIQISEITRILILLIGHLFQQLQFSVACRTKGANSHPERNLPASDSTAANTPVKKWITKVTTCTASWN